MSTSSQLRKLWTSHQVIARIGGDPMPQGLEKIVEVVETGYIDEQIAAVEESLERANEQVVNAAAEQAATDTLKRATATFWGLSEETT